MCSECAVICIFPSLFFRTEVAEMTSAANEKRWESLGKIEDSILKDINNLYTAMSSVK